MSRFSEMSVVDQVHSLYAIYYGRPADPAGLSFWVNEITQVGGDSAIRAFGESAESRALFAGNSTAARVDLVYQTLFSRDADAEGRAFYVDLIDRQIITLAELAVVVLNGVQPGSSDESVVLGRIAAAKKFTTALDTPAELKAYEGAAAIAAGRDFLKSILTPADALQADADFAIAKLVAGPASAGASFTLTANDDAITTTSGNDVITGALGTFQAADIIQDSSAFDNDILNVTASTLNGGSPQIVGIEKINLTWSGTGTINFSADKIKGNQSFATMTPSEITLQATAAGFVGNATVFELGSNNLVSANGITGDLNLTGIDKSTVTTGSATTLTAIGNPGGALAVVVGSALDSVVVGDLSQGVTFTIGANKSLALSEAPNGVASYAVQGTGALNLNTALNTLNGDTLNKFNSAGVFVTLSGSVDADLSRVEADRLTFSDSLSSTISLPQFSNVTLNGANNNVSFNAPVVANAASNTNAIEITVNQAMAGSILSANYADVTLIAAAPTAVAPANGTPKGPDLTVNANFAQAAVTLKGGNDVSLENGAMQSLDASELTGSLTATLTANSIQGAQGVNNLVITSNESTLDIVTNGAADTIDLGMLGTLGTLSNAPRTTTVSTAGGNDVVRANISMLIDGDSLTADLGDGNDTLVITAAPASGSLIIRGGTGDDTLALVNDADISGLTIFSTSLQEIKVLNGTTLVPTSDAVASATLKADLISGISFKVTGQASQAPDGILGQAGAITVDDTLNVIGKASGELIDLSSLLVSTNQLDSILLTINANAGDDTVIGSRASDTIIGGLGKDSMTGGLGADVFTIDNDDSGITVASADSISDFVSGTDKLQLGVAAGGNNYIELVLNAEVAPGFNAALSAANEDFAERNDLEYVFVSSGGNGYLFIANGADAADQAIVLQGLTSNNAFAAGDIIA